MLARGQPEPLGIVSDNAYVYWLVQTPGAVRRVPRGGGAVESYIDALDHPAGFILFKDTFFMSEEGSGRIASAPRTSERSPMLTELVTGEDRPTRMRVDSDSVYWLASGETVLRRWSRKDGSLETLTDQSPLCIGRFTYDGKQVFGLATGTAPSETGEVFRVTTNGESTVLATQQKDPVGIAIDNRFIYWTNRGDRGMKNGTILRLPKDAAAGDSPTELLAAIASPAGISVDAGYVYFTSDTADGIVSRFPKGGGDPLVLASHQSAPFMIVVMEDVYYWLNRGSLPGTASVMKLAKLP